MKLALGTVQLGLPYGVTNTSGQVPRELAHEILDTAWRLGVLTLDTAEAYGTSQVVIGDYLVSHGQSEFEIVTKLTVKDYSEGSLARAFENSLTQLERASTYGLLLHREDDLANPEIGPAVWRDLESIQAAGKVKKIGVSAYDPLTLKSLIETYPIGLIQVPFNLLDHRFFTPDLVELYASRNVEVHVRSVFLQGFLFSMETECPPKLEFARPVYDRLRAMTRGRVPASILSLISALQHPSISKVVVGVNTPKELEEIVSCTEVRGALEQITESDAELQALRELALERLVDPRKW